MSFNFFGGKSKTGKPGNFREMAGKCREISWILGLAEVFQFFLDFLPVLILFIQETKKFPGISRNFQETKKYPGISLRVVGFHRTPDQNSSQFAN